MATIGLKRFRLILFILFALGLIALLGAGYWLKGRYWLDDWRMAQQLSHAVDRVEAVQAPLSEFIQRTGFRPNSPLDARLDEGLLQGDAVIDDIRFGQSALLTVTFRSASRQLQGHTLIFIPEETSSGKWRWRCDEGDQKRLGALRYSGFLPRTPGGYPALRPVSQANVFLVLPYLTTPHLAPVISSILADAN